MLKELAITAAVVVAVLFLLGMVKTGNDKKSLLDTLTSK